jgi:hypothetical protein
MYIAEDGHSRELVLFRRSLAEVDEYAGKGLPLPRTRRALIEFRLPWPRQQGNSGRSSHVDLHL